MKKDLSSLQTTIEDVILESIESNAPGRDLISIKENKIVAIQDLRYQPTGFRVQRTPVQMRTTVQNRT